MHVAESLRLSAGRTDDDLLAAGSHQVGQSAHRHTRKSDLLGRTTRWCELVRQIPGSRCRPIALSEQRPGFDLHGQIAQRTVKGLIVAGDPGGLVGFFEQFRRDVAPARNCIGGRQTHPCLPRQLPGFPQPVHGGRRLFPGQCQRVKPIGLYQIGRTDRRVPVIARRRFLTGDPAIDRLPVDGKPLPAGFDHHLPGHGGNPRVGIGVSRPIGESAVGKLAEQDVFQDVG